MKAAVKHEYVDGRVFSCAESNDVHNTIVGNICTVLIPAARKKGCRTYASDLKIRVENRFYYPDVMFVCDSTLR